MAGAEGGEEGDRPVAVSLSLQPDTALPSPASSIAQHSRAAEAPRAHRSASTRQRDRQETPAQNGFAHVAASGAATARSASPVQRLPAPPPGADRQTDAALLHEKVRQMLVDPLCAHMLVGTTYSHAAAVCSAQLISSILKRSDGSGGAHCFSLQTLTFSAYVHAANLGYKQRHAIPDRHNAVKHT